MNRELLARVRDRIAEVGNEHCDMSHWTRGTVQANGEPECGTSACLAGWTIALHFGTFNELTWARLEGANPEKLLGLPSESLFHVSKWPLHYQDLHDEEGAAKGMLAVCDALLDGSLTFDEDGNLIEAPED